MEDNKTNQCADCNNLGQYIGEYPIDNQIMIQHMCIELNCPIYLDGEICLSFKKREPN